MPGLRNEGNSGTEGNRAMPADRISAAFARARAENRALFIPYVCAGDPDPAVSLEVARALARAGAGLIELGVPFSDPLADGLTNQLAAQRALTAGVRQEDVFALAAALREEFEDLPIIFYTYYNLVHAQGPAAYAARCADAGVDGLLTLDCPPEEAGELLAACRAESLANIFIVAPTTPPARVRQIAAAASGFLYYVSRTGVTGVRDALPEGLAEAVAAIRAETSLPVAVGFGIGKPAQAAEVAQLADGVVVGSALVNLIANAAANGDLAGLPDEIEAAGAPLAAACTRA